MEGTQRGVGRTHIGQRQQEHHASSAVENHSGAGEDKDQGLASGTDHHNRANKDGVVEQETTIAEVAKPSVLILWHHKKGNTPKDGPGDQGNHQTAIGENRVST